MAHLSATSAMVGDMCSATIPTSGHTYIATTNGGYMRPFDVEDDYELDE